MLTRQRIPIPQHDMSGGEKLMTSYPQGTYPYSHNKLNSPAGESGTVTRAYIQHPGSAKIPEYTGTPNGADDKPCAYIYQSTGGYGGPTGYTLAQHVYESPTFERKGSSVHQLNPSDFASIVTPSGGHVNQHAL